MSAHELDAIYTGVVARSGKFAVKRRFAGQSSPAVAEKVNFKKPSRGLVRAPARRVGG